MKAKNIKDGIKSVLCAPAKLRMWGEVSLLAKKAKLTGEGAAKAVQVEATKLEEAVDKSQSLPSSSSHEPMPKAGAPAKKAKVAGPEAKTAVAKGSSMAKALEKVSAKLKGDGILVRVTVEDLLFKLFFGKEYLRVSEDPDGLSTVAEIEISTRHKLPTTLLQDVSGLKKPTAVLTALRKSRAFKQTQLILAGIPDPIFIGKLEQIGKRKPECPLQVAVDLGLVQLLSTFKGTEHCALHSTLQLMVAEHTANPPKEGTREHDHYAKVKAYIRNKVAKHKLCLIPIWARFHYTLLVVEVSESGAKLSRYYEGMNEPNKHCLALATKVCEILGCSLSDREHKSRQIGATCACFILHYAEEELRKRNGEGAGLSGWPDLGRMAEVRSRLSNWVAAVEGERAKWAVDEDRKLLDKQVQVERFLAMAKAKHEAGQLGAQARDEAELFAKQCMDDTEAKTCQLEVPEQWEIAFKRLQEIRVENRLKLLLLRKEEAAAAAAPQEVAAAALSGEAKPSEESEKPAKPEAKPSEESEMPATPAVTDTPAKKEDWRLDLLSDVRHRECLRVRAEGKGICSKCRYAHGCLKCCFEKALRYHLGKQGYVGPAIWRC